MYNTFRRSGTYFVVHCHRRNRGDVRSLVFPDGDFRANEIKQLKRNFVHAMLGVCEVDWAEYREMAIC